MPEKISFATLDGVTIVGEWQAAPTVAGAVILLHMMRSDKSSWKQMQDQLAKKGLASLAIDMRGHGESIISADGKKLNYRLFKDEEHQAKIMDVMGAFNWIRERGMEPQQINLCGASFGANLCVKMLTEEPELVGAALLSPGLDYHGLQILKSSPFLQTDQKLFIVSSEDDVQSFEGSRRLYEESPVTDKIFIPYKGAGHGTEILEADKNLKTKIADWLLKTIRL
ncbi:MAG: alpha/beta fold hydrolase [Patescibacteria group bacterium]